MYVIYNIILICNVNCLYNLLGIKHLLKTVEMVKYNKLTPFLRQNVSSQIFLFVSRFRVRMEPLFQPVVPAVRSSPASSSTWNWSTLLILRLLLLLHRITSENKCTILLHFKLPEGNLTNFCFSKRTFTMHGFWVFTEPFEWNWHYLRIWIQPFNTSAEKIKFLFFSGSCWNA